VRVRNGNAGLRHVSSLVGGALLGTSLVLPILAGGDGVERDTLVLFLSGLLTVLGIGMHLSGSSGRLHVRRSPSTVPPTSVRDYPRPARASRESGADARLIV
jgi:hypothetical protein